MGRCLHWQQIQGICGPRWLGANVCFVLYSCNVGVQYPKDSKSLYDVAPSYGFPRGASQISDSRWVSRFPSCARDACTVAAVRSTTPRHGRCIGADGGSHGWQWDAYTVRWGVLVVCHVGLRASLKVVYNLKPKFKIRCVRWNSKHGPNFGWSCSRRIKAVPKKMCVTFANLDWKVSTNGISHDFITDATYFFQWQNSILITGRDRWLCYSYG